MANVYSDVTDLPLNCKSAAEHTQRILDREDSLAELTDSDCRKLTKWEKELEKETGCRVALVAYRV